MRYLMASLGSRARVALVGLLGAIVYLAGLGRPPLWEPDEGRYAEIPREMVVSGDYITPRNDWVRYFEKPPLVYWTTAASLKLFGENEFAVRLPAALFSAGEVALTVALAETMFGAAAGLLAALALALSPLFFGFARFATLDPALAFFVVAGLSAFYMAALAPPLGSGAGRRWLILAAALAALGTLAKGPVALVLTGGVALVYLAVARRLSEVAGVPWLACAAVYLAIVAPWFVAVSLKNPGFLAFFFVHEHLQRYLASGEHYWGAYFLVAVAAAGTWPWVYFVPLGLGALWRPAQEGAARTASALRFLLVWFGFVLVFFSIPRSKLGSYILSGIPPLAILAGFGLSRLFGLTPEKLTREFRLLWIINAVVAGAAVVALVTGGEGVPRSLVLDGAIVTAGFLLSALVALLIVRRGAGPAPAIAALALGTVVALGGAIRARADAGPWYTYRGLARAIKPYLDPGCVLASYGHFVQSLPFYTGHREALVSYRGELGEFDESPDAAGSFIRNDRALGGLWGSSRCFVLVIDRPDIARVVPKLTPGPSVIGCSGKKVALYNRPVLAPSTSCAPPPATR